MTSEKDKKLIYQRSEIFDLKLPNTEASYYGKPQKVPDYCINLALCII